MASFYMHQKGGLYMNTIPQFHGSDLEAVAEYFHLPQEKIICFGANVNPLGLSSTVKNTLAEHLDIISSYPDRNYTSLKKQIATYCQVSPQHILVGNGCTELISLFIQLLKPKKALLPIPSYSEYEREISLIGGTVEYFPLLQEDNFTLSISSLYKALENNIDLLILCNPNNPTSTAIQINELKQILSFCKERNIFVIIDETYVEFVENIAEITATPLTDFFDNLIVLRGVSKFFAAPGLRFGYGITGNVHLLAELDKIKNPWSLNSIGAYAGELLLSDMNYMQKTHSLISSERKRICKKLRTFPFIQVYEPAANFILLKICKDNLTSHDVFIHAIQKGLMIRDCSTFIGLTGEFIRFCIMNPKENDRLLDCLEEILS